jgi:hypothetical protein
LHPSVEECPPFFPRRNGSHSALWHYARFKSTSITLFDDVQIYRRKMAAEDATVSFCSINTRFTFLESASSRWSDPGHALVLHQYVMPTRWAASSQVAK